MKILLASSEVVPFAKTGGLADVCGALPAEIQRLGHEVAVFMPAYQTCKNAGVDQEDTGIRIPITVGSKIVEGALWKSHLPHSDVVVYLVHQPDYFDRVGLYQDAGEDYKDNCERFVFFCRFILESLERLNWFPDVLHANDWQTGLLPAYLKTVYAEDPRFQSIATLMTIHNLAYQGNFWHWDMLITGIDWQYFNWQQMEFYGRLNLLKTGIVFADKLSTVSPSYALEIQTTEQGHGLDTILRERSADLIGILNGIDTNEWNPAKDNHLAANYSADDWQTGKAFCKSDLQKAFGLDADPTRPLIGIVGRIASQKGWALILEVAKQWLATQTAVQWAILGTGDSDLENELQQLAQTSPHTLAARLEFSNELAHKVEAGSDIFLMPSLFEPCGLNQQYSMQYGTVPVVHETGGLADTVINYTDETLSAGTANGFSFSGFHAHQLEQALARAIETYAQPEIWKQIVENGMNHDWSWAASARRYESAYQAIHRARFRPQSA